MENFEKIKTTQQNETGSDRKTIERIQKEIDELEGTTTDSMARGDQVAIRRKLALLRSELNRLQNGNFGRRIPEEISRAVIERDTTRNFGRPNHKCKGHRPPHHIRFFETFTGSHTNENPHTLENLEAPCKDCHELAHNLDIQSGVSIESFFKSFNKETWELIERAWEEGGTYLLKDLGKKKKFT